MCLITTLLYPKSWR